MSKISDELREHGNGYFEQRNGDYEWFHSIADRIDAEMVELPKAADKKPIHMGDTLYSPDGNEHHVWFMCRHFSEQWRWMVFDVAPDLFMDHELVPLLLSHTRPDSLERIANEMDEFVDDTPGIDTFYASTASRLRDFAKRIRKIAKEQTNE